MYCKNCGNPMDDVAVVCVKCGAARETGANFCYNCGQPLQPGAAFCTQCGAATAPAGTAPAGYAPVGTVPAGYQQKSKLAAALLGIFLGGFGIHNFYLGFTTKAIIQIVVTLVTCGIGSLWGFIEGILIIAGSTITADAHGVPLKD